MAIVGDFAIDPLTRRVYQRVHTDDDAKVTRWRTVESPLNWVWTNCTTKCGSKCMEIIARLIPAKGGL